MTGTSARSDIDLRVDVRAAIKEKPTHTVCLACYPSAGRSGEFSAICSHPFPQGTAVTEPPVAPTCTACAGFQACQTCLTHEPGHRCGGSA